MSILIRHGVSNQVTKEVADYPTTESILGCPNLQQFLGFGANVEARVNGVAGQSVLSDGDTVDIQSRANKKG